MRALSGIKVRFTLRLHSGIKAGLEELQARRAKECVSVDVSDLLNEAALMLLMKEGIPVGNSKPVPPSPPAARKPMKSARRKRPAVAVEA
jgi:hypothetical protein